MTQHGFELLREATISELGTHARLFRHVRTGAELLSLENDDENKSFGVVLKTPPEDSTGLPHILEHSVLAGSRKYPTKEPFVNLLKTSLNTFLNAMTFPDMTVYPVASTNLKDFYNLVDVYLDAVFYPLITEKTFQQEGWHYEAGDKDAPLTYKGVVFNEMKGYASTPDIVLQDEVRAALLPDTPYRYNYGGDPAAIPNLTYAQFKKFHQTYYHPSNARFFFWGDDEPAERLRLIDAFITDFNAQPVNAEMPLQPRFAAPRSITKPYDAGEADDDSNKAMMTVNWLLPQVTDAEAMLELAILEHILIETPASPLRKALIDSGMGEDVAGEGLDIYAREAMFSVGLKGIQGEDAEAAESLVLQTLGEIAEQGIDPAMIEAALNTTEFALRERNTGQFPRGLAVFMNIISAWTHGGDPLQHIAFETDLNTIKARAAEEGYFESLIGKYLLDNPHRTTVTLLPDPQVKVERDQAETQRLAGERARMSAEAIEAVIADMEELQRLQAAPDNPEDIAKIPTLGLNDIEREIKLVPTEVMQFGGSTVMYHDLQTSGVAYFDIGFDLYALPERLLPYVDLFGRALLEIGTEEEDFVRLSQRIGAKTGGIRPEVFASVKYNSRDTVAYLFLRAKTMLPQAPDMFALLRDILLSVKLDNQERFLQMVLEEKAGQEAYLGLSGHALANSRLRAHYDDAGYLAEQTGGVSNLFFVRQLAGRVENDWASVLQDLEAVRAALINQNGALVNVTLDAAGWEQLQPQVADFVSLLPALPIQKQTWQRSTFPEYEGFTVPTQVNFVGKGANLFDVGYQPHGSHIVILKHMNLDYMWAKVRVQGGAYGGTCLFNMFSGVATFLSWQDPNIAKTLANYDGAAEYLQQLALSADDLEKAIIGAIGQVDKHLLPDAKGFGATQRYLLGYTDAQRQQLRDEILGTTLEDFKKFGDVLAQARSSGHVVVTASPDSIAKANKELNPPLQITPVM